MSWSFYASNVAPGDVEQALNESAEGSSYLSDGSKEQAAKVAKLAASLAEDLGVEKANVSISGHYPDEGTSQIPTASISVSGVAEPQES